MVKFGSWVHPHLSLSKMRKIHNCPCWGYHKMLQNWVSRFTPLKKHWPSILVFGWWNGPQNAVFSFNYIGKFLKEKPCFFFNGTREWPSTFPFNWQLLRNRKKRKRVKDLCDFQAFWGFLLHQNSSILQISVGANEWPRYVYTESWQWCSNRMWKILSQKKAWPQLKCNDTFCGNQT